MPIYDITCESCGDIDDAIASLAQHENKTCPDCSKSAVYHFNPVNVAIQGIIFANAEHNQQLGVVFETNKQKRDYMKKEGLVEFGKGSATDKNVAWMSQQRAEKAAVAQGFKSDSNKKSTLTKAKARGWNPSRAANECL